MLPRGLIAPDCGRAALFVERTDFGLLLTTLAQPPATQVEAPRRAAFQRAKQRAQLGASQPHFALAPASPPAPSTIGYEIAG